ncbi:hypothetical protein HY29_01520 [Hyphomonas beringensis]|uniref:Uncharacterized protein n=1 Tax=Hyphomonas beringensis TaxID=1280946 RepID=A0A062UFK9_9PROT|nr:hypothetical protein HY29_01520 [Hyphomonas beringensis]
MLHCHTAALEAERNTSMKIKQNLDELYLLQMRFIIEEYST